MADMTQAQVKYARQRAEQVYADKKSTLRQEFQDKGVMLNIEDRLRAIVDGEFTVTETQEHEGAHSWYYHIKFNAERNPVFDNDGYTAAEKELRTLFIKLTDELMLGDNQEALKLIKEFEAA